MFENIASLSDFAFFTDLLCHMNKLNVQLHEKTQFIHLKSFKQKLVLFADQLAKNDLPHFARLNSTTVVRENKLRSYENKLRKLRGESERRF